MKYLIILLIAISPLTHSEDSQSKPEHINQMAYFTLNSGLIIATDLCLIGHNKLDIQDLNSKLNVSGTSVKELEVSTNESNEFLKRYKDSKFPLNEMVKVQDILKERLIGIAPNLSEHLINGSKKDARKTLMKYGPEAIFATIGSRLEGLTPNWVDSCTKILDYTKLWIEDEVAISDYQLALKTLPKLTKKEIEAAFSISTEQISEFIKNR